MNNNRRKHLYHIVNPSVRPYICLYSLFYITSGLVFYLYKYNYIFFNLDLTLIGIVLLFLVVKDWYKEIIEESTYLGYHTIVVQQNLIYGFLLFIASEIMLFFGFFWAFFHSALYPDMSIGCVFPPKDIIIIEPLKIPLFNTYLLILSGFSVTWTHRSITNNNTTDVIDSFIITIFLGLFFLFLQGFEYYESYFCFNDSIYACTFYMLTGLHGMHVFVGVSFLILCFVRYLNKEFLINHHLSFIFAAWYWHFVDIVWIFLYITIYLWGSLY